MLSKEEKEHKKALKKLLRDKIKEEVKGSWRNYEEVTEWGFMKAYEIYRSWSSLVLLFFSIFFFIKGNNVLGVILIGFVHLHLLFNQLWHRLVAIHYLLQKKEVIK